MWNDKNYHTLDYEMKGFFGEKAIKLSIDGGFTCPNRDGTIGVRGCIFCSERGSGDFNSESCKSISEQISEQREIMSRKWKSSTYIAYFQSYTNTYDTVENLRKKFNEALICENIKGIAIATRPDCISEEVLELLAELNEKTFLWVELGLQTINNSTVNLIRRGYSHDVFEKTAKMLKTKNIRTVIHLIMGLPGEDREQMLKNISYVSALRPWGVKIHMLHILQNTDLAKFYLNTHFNVMSHDEYVELICDSLELLNEDIVIHRLTGDGRKSDLIEPRWTLNKLKVLSDIDKELKKRNSRQGKYAPL
ncbi:TIGR01212 family radical SAM protein [Sedimentibacter saalensis]|uniref:TIGR01212 family radical SAM protein n=1 Tax=Sedimentibacter saalensis TaxID=130788 RepID=UPI0028980214|nr:TIGR01212 family radical SAM protein [Sedimentibacter saalensis]